MAKRPESKPESVPAGPPVADNPVPETAAPGNVVEHEEIAQLAYSYWEARGYQGGLPEDDWFRAEQELKAQRTTTKAMMRV